MNEYSPIEPFEPAVLPQDEALSSDLTNLIQQFMSAADDLNTLLSSSIISKLTKLLTGKKLRYFVWQDERSGSVANTINMLRSMISLGFQVDVELIYNSAQKTLLKELAELLPGFDPTTRAPYTLNDITITFFAYEEATVGEITHRQVRGLKSKMPLCLCGGGDIPNIDNTSIATAVKCDYFVLLQPYLWATENSASNSKIILPGLKRSINLDDQLVLQGDQFTYRSFKQDLSAKPNWKALQKIPKVNKMALSAAQNITNAIGKSAQNGIEFLPVASLPSSSRNKTSLVGSAEGIAFELIAATTLLQKQKAFSKKPVVIAILDDLSSSTWQTLGHYFPEKNASNQSTTSSSDALTKNVSAYCKAQQLFRNTSGSGTGIYLNKDLSGAAGKAFLSKLKPGSTVVTTLQGLPPEAINHLYAVATLPGVLQGTKTSNLAVNLGKPFFKLTDFTVNPYPSTFGNGSGKAASSTTPTTAALLDISKNQIALGLSAFQDGFKASMPPNELARSVSEITTQYRSGKGEYFEYFDGLKQYYTAPQNDKLLQTLGFLTARFALIKMTESIFSDLSQLKETLQEATKDGKLSLIPNVVKEGPFHQFLTSILGGGALSIGSAKDPVSIKPVYRAKKLSQIIVTGKTSDFLGTELTVTLTVYRIGRTTKKAGQNYKVRLEVDLQKLSLPGVKWFALEDTGLFAEFSSNGARLTGGVQTSVELGETLVPFQMNFPSSASNKMVVQGALANEAAPSLNAVFTLIGGMNFANAIPTEFADLNELNIDGLRFNYDSTKKTIESFQISLKDNKEWDLFGGLSIKDLSFDVTAQQPTGSRKVSWVAATQAVIGTSDNPPTLDVSATYPQTTVTATLNPEGPNLPVEDLVDALLPKGYHLNVGADIANLSLEYSPGQGKNNSTYAVQAGVDLEGWTISLAPASFELKDIYIDVKGIGNNSTGTIKASTMLFEGVKGVQPVLVSVSATFDTQSHLWTFTGEQGDTPIKVSQIIAAYLGSGWATDKFDLDVTGLNVTFSTGSGKTASSYEFGGTVNFSNKDKKKVSWLPENVTFTAKIGNSGGNELLLPVNKARVPVLNEQDEIVFLEPDHSLPRFEKSSNDNQYALLTADIVWNKIDLTAFYQYGKKKSAFGIQWGALRAEVNEQQVATIKFTEATTLGGIIETFVEWMTGARFGLAAPFDLLNDVKLSDLELTWDLKNEKVCFQIDIGPIDLLIASIRAISLNYNKDTGVSVNVWGDFPWLNEMDSEKEKPLSWRADQPSTTPSPGGAGNKYLDLRLLAGGQHVNVKGLQQANTVQQAVDILGCLHEPSADKVPDIGFDGDINWLFATDFGVLRIDSSKELGEEHWGELEKGGAQYAFTLQVVLTDPSLYALRIACNGKAAKVFSGLDFQVIYKKVSEGLGKFSASIQLPEIMRRIDVGAVTITLPTFGIEVYTNGDFQIDVGFPWNNNFSQSFSVEAIVPPGIPVKGGGGFYFGKLPAASVKGLPVSSKGFFNPNLVFGFGAQLGLGKSFEMGILKAGFSLTAFGILQGVLAKWNAYHDKHTDSGNALSLQGEYFFSLTGTFGIIGKLYGSIDFAIIKASVNIRIEVSAQIKLASYEPIPITVAAKVDVSASASIDLGLFTIKVSFSFSAHVHTTFTLGALQNPKDAPWLDHSKSHEGLLVAPLAERLALYSRVPMLPAGYEAEPMEFNWSNLKAATDPSKNPLEIHLGYGLTLAKDENWSPSAQGRPPQLPCYVANLFIEAPAPSKPQDTELFEKASGAQPDTAFEALAKMTTRWLIAATMGDEEVTAKEVDSHPISAVEINSILDTLSTSPDVLTESDISKFLQQQFQLDIAVPARTGEAQATYFPMVPDLSIALKVGDKTTLSYSFAEFNKISPNYLQNLTNYFNQLAVQVENESGKDPSETISENAQISIASYIYKDYFMLIMKQMMQSLLDGLRDFNYPLVSGETPDGIVAWVKGKGGTGYTLADLFKTNGAHPLTSNVELTVPTASLVVPAGKTLKELAEKNQLNAAVKVADLICKNKDVAGLLINGAKITYTASDGTKTTHITSGSETFCSVAKALGIKLEELSTNSSIPTQRNLLVAGTTLQLPEFTHKTSDADTLSSVAQKFETKAEALALPANGNITDLFVVPSRGSSSSLSIAHLPQFCVGELIKEVQRTGGITHLSGMASRYYFHGMRLPTKNIASLKEDITPLTEGMWVQKDEDGELTLPEEAGLFALSGQQILIPTPLTTSFSMLLGKPENADWITLGNDTNPLQYPVVVPKGEEKPSKDYERIEAIIKCGAKGYLPAGPCQLSLLASVDQQPSAFPIPHYINWQSAKPIPVPSSSSTQKSNSQYLRLWTLSGALTALGAQDGEALPPHMIVEQAAQDAATGKTIKAPLVNFGWTSTIEFSIKKLPQQHKKTSNEATGSSDNALKTTYELNGVSSSGTVVLERMLQSLPEDHSFTSITLGYTKGSQSSGTHFVGEGGSNVTFGISQTNLSTVTNPGSELFLQERKQTTGPTLLNTPMNLVKLLWEAGITNSGGVYLYYTADDGQSGLPSDIFNEKGEATLTLVIIHEDRQHLHPYINGLATAQPLASSEASLTASAKGELVEHTVQPGDTLASIARLYHSNLNSLITNTLSSESAEIELIKGKTILIEQGTYMVPQSTSAPGASFASIALRFGTTVDQLKQINPSLKDENLPAGTPLRLPAIELTIAAKTLSNDLIKLTDLKKIAGYFGTEPIVIAVSNAEQEDLLVTGQTFTTRAGPLSVQPGEHPGVQALNAQRAKPQPVPSGGTGTDYAKALLFNNYSLLAYQVTENQDFKSSNMGLPIGASGKSTSPDENKVRYVLEASTGDAEQYHGAISYLGLVKDNGKDKPHNPYIANGRLLQTKLGWNDYYGNTILSTLEDYADPAGKLSNKPALQGYTDQIIPLSQWPSTSASWTVAMSKDPEKTFTLMVSFSFDTSPFIPQKGQNPSIAQQRARSALVIVEDMLAQFEDPNGFEVEVDTSLVSDTYALTDGELKQLIGWWQGIQKFLQEHSAAGGKEPGPKSIIPPLKLPVTMALADVCTDQVFELVTKLIFKRTHGIAVGDYAADPLARSVSNTVAIKTNVSAPRQSDKEPKKPKPDILSEFAECVAKAIQGADFQMMVASGINRYAPSAGLSSNATWAVRVGRQEGDPISFRITDKCQPELYAPLPVSNTLISRNASIYPYTSLDDFNPHTGEFTGTPVKSTFSNVEMDVWLKQYFDFFDGLLSPKYSSSILFIDHRLQSQAVKDGTPKPTGFMEQLADQKESLAGITSNMLAPIYQDGTSTRLASAQETFRQSLLNELSNLYTTQAAISFGADLTASIPLQGNEETPQLYGNINLNSLKNCPPQAEENASPATSETLSSLISMTSPKLKLQQDEEQPLTFLLEASEKLGETTECLCLDLCYKVTALEHQISPVKNIEGYKASSWLSPITAEDTPVLEKSLGSFKLPILLRSFPETPRMVSQAGPAFDKKATQLNKITRWDYEYTYGLNFHYLQDKAHGLIQFNIKDKPANELAGFLDAFAELAQFISVANNLSAILDQYVPVISAAKQDDAAIEDAASVLSAIIKINEDIIKAASAAGNLSMLAAPGTKEGSESYKFSIVEENQAYASNNEGTADRWVVKLILEDCNSLKGLTGEPTVEIPEWTSHLASKACEKGKKTYTYYYTQEKKKKTTYLTQDIAQSISDRQVILPGMQVLARQDAIASMYMTRNNNIYGKINEGFVFRTPTATFKNPFHPTLSSYQPLNIAWLDEPMGEPSKCSLTEHLNHLFCRLFKNEFVGDVTLQLNIGYAYHLSEGLTEEPIDLPIALLPPTPISITTKGKPKGNIIKNLAKSITDWAAMHKPSCNNARLTFALNIMSNLTENPMPLLNLQDLYLCTDDIEPPLPSYEGQMEEAR